MEKLVETVTLQVFKALTETPPPLEQRGKKILILEKDGNSLWQAIAKEIVSPTDKVEDINSLEREKDLEKYDYIILPSLTVKRLTNIATGIRNDHIEEGVSDVLLLGKRIYLLQEGIEYRRYKKTANKSYYLMVEEYEKRLMNFGIKIVNKIELYETIKFGELEGNPLKASLDSKDKKIITETEVKQGIQEGFNRIKVNEKTIITPLAHDLIRANKIEVVTEK